MTGEYTVYGAAGSGSVPVEAALTLIGAAYSVVEAPTWEGDRERDKVAPVNPMRQLPALVTPDGETLTESAAILIWLAERYPEARLGPAAGDPMRGRFLRWMSFIPASIYSMYWARDVPARLAGDDAAAQAVLLERTAARISDCWAVMEGEIEPEGRFLLGDRVSVLDLYLAVVSRWRPLRPAFHRVAPRLGQVARRVDAMPELAGFWARRFPFEGDYRDETPVD
ncbi:MAG: glutathione S-transferase family protein [Alphaproteobacteria bacterium]|nr:glutathione S-transferase family protein [Alphaproteobacteria bacterium]MBU2377890.1 glutathione S-transferase family protein [Alphaproteobacteria bacterium]